MRPAYTSRPPLSELFLGKKNSTCMRFFSALFNSKFRLAARIWLNAVSLLLKNFLNVDYEGIKRDENTVSCCLSLHVPYFFNYLAAAYINFLITLKWIFAINT